MRSVSQTAPSGWRALRRDAAQLDRSLAALGSGYRATGLWHSRGDPGVLVWRWLCPYGSERYRFR